MFDIILNLYQTPKLQMDEVEGRESSTRRVKLTNEIV